MLFVLFITSDKCFGLGRFLGTHRHPVTILNEYLLADMPLGKLKRDESTFHLLENKI